MAGHSPDISRSTIAAASLGVGPPEEAVLDEAVREGTAVLEEAVRGGAALEGAVLEGALREGALREGALRRGRVFLLTASYYGPPGGSAAAPPQAPELGIEGIDEAAERDVHGFRQAETSRGLQCGDTSRAWHAGPGPARPRNRPMRDRRVVAPGIIYGTMFEGIQIIS
jgi:hypothetical protein